MKDVTDFVKTNRTRPLLAQKKPRRGKAASIKSKSKNRLTPDTPLVKSESIEISRHEAGRKTARLESNRRKLIKLTQRATNEDQLHVFAWLRRKFRRISPCPLKEPGIFELDVTFERE